MPVPEKAVFGREKIDSCRNIGEIDETFEVGFCPSVAIPEFLVILGRPHYSDFRFSVFESFVADGDDVAFSERMRQRDIILFGIDAVSLVFIFRLEVAAQDIALVPQSRLPEVFNMTDVVDITAQVQKIVTESGVKDGICVVFVPHTTAAVTINENADPDVQTDFMKEINKIVPWEDNYRHMEGNSAAHLKASMMGFSETVLIDQGRLLLGTWQGIYFLEYDGARSRRVYVKILEG